MPAKKYHGGRALLNKPGFESTAALVAEVLDTSKASPDDDIWADITYQLSDCSRAVNLSFHIHSPEHRRNSLAKARKVAELTNKFVEGLEKECALAEQREKDQKKR